MSIVKVWTRNTFAFSVSDKSLEPNTNKSRESNLMYRYISHNCVSTFWSKRSFYWPCWSVERYWNGRKRRVIEVSVHERDLGSDCYIPVLIWYEVLDQYKSSLVYIGEVWRFWMIAMVYCFVNIDKDNFKVVLYWGWGGGRVIVYLC